ncbi:hypothetical protein [Niabella hirudinis]|uniref:hypothetical protein n=1 Tax=Niabella hirudinis TaxID=1285929 RepID=UPI003EBAD4FD
MSIETNLTPEEKETVRFILAELSEQYQENTKIMASLVSEIKELTSKIQQMIYNQERQQLPENNVVASVKAGTEKLESLISRLSFPSKAIQELYRKLSAVEQQLSTPLTQKIEHHYRIHKIVLLMVPLFVVSLLFLWGWLNTKQELKDFTTNDTKYRCLRLDTANTALQRYLDKVDEAYTRNPKFRDSVIAKEEENKRNMKLLLDAYSKTREAEKLKSEAEKIKKSINRQQIR